MKYAAIPSNEDIAKLLEPNRVSAKCPGQSRYMTAHKVSFDAGPDLNQIPTQCSLCKQRFTTDQRIDIWLEINAKAKQTAQVNS